VSERRIVTISRDEALLLYDRAVDREDLERADGWADLLLDRNEVGPVDERNGWHAAAERSC
jgi:hypothetical protein